MKKPHRSRSHPTDGQLVRYLDAELYELDERRVRNHVRGCGRCSGRLDSLATAARTASRLIGDAPVHVDEMARARALAAMRKARPAARRPVGRVYALRAAAAAGAIFVLGLSVDPVRAWLSSAWESVQDEVTAEPVVTLPAIPVVHRSSVVAFEPGGSVFDVRVQYPQAGGTLIVRVEDVDRASAQMVGGADETFLVLPQGLRIENAPESTGDYVITVPATVRRLDVQLADQTLGTIRPASRDAPWEQEFELR